jgi:hypothetical protein
MFFKKNKGGMVFHRLFSALHGVGRRRRWRMRHRLLAPASEHFTLHGLTFLNLSAANRATEQHGGRAVDTCRCAKRTEVERQREMQHGGRRVARRRSVPGLACRLAARRRVALTSATATGGGGHRTPRWRRAVNSASHCQ